MVASKEQRHDLYLVMGDRVTTVEGVTFVAMRPFRCAPVEENVRTTIQEPPPCADDFDDEERR